MVNFADRMDNIRASDVRELLKLTARPEIISFAGGLPGQRCEALRFKDGVSLVDVAHRRGEHGLRIGYEEEAVVHPGGEPGGEGAVHQGVEDSGVPGGRPDGDGKQRLQFLGVVERQECRGSGHQHGFGILDAT